MPSPILHLSPLQRTVFSASLSGQMSMLDPRTGFKTTSTVQAHTGGLNGADAQGHLVCTWGWTHMAGHPLPDPLVRLYDVRTLRALPPISFPAGPAFCLLHPTDPSRLVISSQQGMLQLVDLNSSDHFQQLDVNSYIVSMTLSPGGDYLAFGDADGHAHLWTTHETGYLPPFNAYEGVKPEWPDASDPPPAIPWDRYVRKLTELTIAPSTSLACHTTPNPCCPTFPLPTMPQTPRHSSIPPTRSHLQCFPQ